LQDDLIGRVREDRASLLCASEAGRWIDWRLHLRLHRGSFAKRLVIQRLEILIRGAGDAFWRPPSRLNLVQPLCVRLNDRRVNAEGFAANQIFRNAAGQHRLEQMAEEVTIAKAAMAVLRKGGMIWNWVSKIETTKQRYARFR